MTAFVKNRRLHSSHQPIRSFITIETLFSSYLSRKYLSSHWRLRTAVHCLSGGRRVSFVAWKHEANTHIRMAFTTLWHECSTVGRQFMFCLTWRGLELSHNLITSTNGAQVCTLEINDDWWDGNTDQLTANTFCGLSGMTIITMEMLSQKSINFRLVFNIRKSQCIKYNFVIYTWNYIFGYKFYTDYYYYEHLLDIKFIYGKYTYKPFPFWGKGPCTKLKLWSIKDQARSQPKIMGR